MPGHRLQLAQALLCKVGQSCDGLPLACRITSTGYTQADFRERLADRVERFTRPCAERHFAGCAVVTVAVAEVHGHAAVPACMNVARESAIVPDGAAFVGWLECSQDDFADCRRRRFYCWSPH